MAKNTLHGLERDELLRGAIMSLLNTFDLINDAHILQKKNRFPRAFALYQLSQEESGKVFGLLELLINQGIYDRSFPNWPKSELDKVYNKVSKMFYEHKAKTKYIIEREIGNYKMFLMGHHDPDAPILQKQKKELEDELKNFKQYDELKNLSLYTSLDSMKFVKPDEKINEDLVNSIMHSSFTRFVQAKQAVIKYQNLANFPSEFDFETIQNLRPYLV